MELRSLLELKTKNIGENTYKKEVNKTSTSYKKKTQLKASFKPQQLGTTCSTSLSCIIPPPPPKRGIFALSSMIWETISLVSTFLELFRKLASRALKAQVLSANVAYFPRGTSLSDSSSIEKKAVWGGQEDLKRKIWRRKRRTLKEATQKNEEENT